MIINAGRVKVKLIVLADGANNDVSCASRGSKELTVFSLIVKYLIVEIFCIKGLADIISHTTK
jgi:hypothetical protein